ncbi:hypothetical protein [Flavobacterium nitrogenifigens]|uniref:DUF3592 domain-containing protein n=1 Tax=Flavobacterium nitrogenifigens TaxID=1617283 RepID=A0A521F669_9FLAO|nr:hypothetical protein [Flavobacterium nitrogenifigens]KAF2336654.1 hypothetical protein DM397_05295 [Flavobacterium nitrogenifigens]SMO91647.1 hypothetical protein SAMN06265220_106117 [Flavobacterium nitrogenifigens]
MENKLKLINRYKNSLIWIVIILLMFWFLGIRPEIRVSELKENGKLTKAYLYEVKRVGSKGTIRGFYRFKVNNNLYEGFYDNDNLKISDSIDIIYLPDNPERNQAKQFVEDY